MNLIIDIGNTAAKIAVIDGDQTVFSTVQEELNTSTLNTILQNHPSVSQAILSTTRHPDKQIETYLDRQVDHFIRFDNRTPVPLTNRYDTPETLGSDRIAAAVGAWALAPDQELLIVDLGSAITLDRVNSAGEYLGGNISPGMAMRFASLHQLTDRLPLCTTPNTYNPTSRSTRSAIESGVVLGIIHEIEGYIDHLREERSSIIIFFTGQDANYFADNVKKPIFVVRDLVTKGLNQILDYNIQPQY